MKKMFLFTARYPGGNAESFIEPELSLLAKRFSEIHIFPLMDSAQGTTRNLPNNVVLHSAPIIKKITIKSFRLFFLKIIFIEFLKSNKKWLFLKSLKRNIQKLIQCYDRSIAIEKEISENLSDTVFYTFWMEDWATTLAFYKKRHPDLKFISRVHGFDLYDERTKEGIIPWRYFQLENISVVVTAADQARKHLQNKFPSFHEKIKRSYLGISDLGFIADFHSRDEFTLVSCSNLIPLKRVDLLVELLMKVNFNLKWVHFGDGIEMEKIRQKISGNKNNRFQYDLRGRISPSEILNYYENNKVDLFVHLSTTEGGVPLAIQEALSFGIPVIACDTGGVAEIVNSETGKLLSIDFSSKQFHEELENLSLGFCKDADKRRKAKEYWREHFEIQQSFANFMKIIENV